MQHAGRIVPVAALLAVACGTQVVATTPSYPAVSGQSVETRLSFTPASGITKLALPCTKAEREIDNGLDDNCDGRVDRQTEPSRAGLFISLAHSTQVDVELTLTASDPASEASLDKSMISRVQVCQSAEPFALQQAAFPKLAKGRYELAVAHGKVCGEGLPAAVDASLWLQGQTQGVYGLSVPPGERAVLGTIEVR